ncbi:MAG: TPM domain-containing protein [Leptospiraceae bacterium]|nr:TPM domain-containing protein [Leptospiraceae bacterium]
MSPSFWNNQVHNKGMIRRGLLAVAASMVLFASSIQGQEVAIPDIQAPVTDQVGLLSSSAVQQLNQKILNLQKEKGSQIAILIISTTNGEPIEDYSMRAAEKLKIGRQGVDDGIIITIARDDRKARIEVGYGLEGAVPDATANRILDTQMLPAFKKGDFEAGLNRGVDSLIALIRGEALPEPSAMEKVGQGFDTFAQEFQMWGVFYIIGVTFYFIGGLVPMLLSRWKSALTFLVATIVGVTVYLIFGVLPIGIFAAGLTAFLMGIFTVTITAASQASADGGSYSSGSSWSSGSSSSFSSGSSSSFSSGSSFSGGGGSFGGGGASGSW